MSDNTQFQNTPIGDGFVSTDSQTAGNAAAVFTVGDSPDYSSGRTMGNAHSTVHNEVAGDSLASHACVPGGV